jgi:release factor glutamine methyltransferase
MTIQAALREGYSILNNARVGTPFLDAAVLLSEALSCSKEQLYTQFLEDLGKGSLEAYRHYLELRCEGLPVSYIRQKKEFFGIEFKVDERVFVPRPETESLVEVTLELIGRVPRHAEGSGDNSIRLHDVCTGSGCIAIALKHERPRLSVSASDISEKTQEVFEINSHLILGEVLPFTLSDLLEGVEGPFDILVSNPPYLRKGEVRKMKESGWPEPELALDGGDEGTDLEIRLISAASQKLRHSGYLVLEADPDQMKTLSAAMSGWGFEEVRIVKDLTGSGRVVYGRFA